MLTVLQYRYGHQALRLGIGFEEIGIVMMNAKPRLATLVE